MQNRAVLTVSNRRVRGDRYRFGLTVPWHHGKTDSETRQPLFYVRYINDHIPATYIPDKFKTTSHFRVSHVDQGPNSGPHREAS